VSGHQRTAPHTSTVRPDHPTGHGSVTGNRAVLLIWVGRRFCLGTRCNTCDNCLAAAQHGDDLTRDFGAVSRLILQVLQFSQGAYPFPMSKLLTLISGSFSGRRNSGGSFIGGAEAQAMNAVKVR
jgi:hypothetical protein